MNHSAAKSPTPILDLESPLPEKFRWDRLTWRQALLIVVLPLVAISLLVPVFVVLNDSNPAVARIFSYVGTKLDTLFKGSGAHSPALLFMVYFFALFLVISIHELAHLAGALAVGFQFERMRIGPLTLAKSTHGLKITVQRMSSFDGIAAIRIQQLRKLHQKFAIFIAAGPFANFLSGLCAWLCLATPLGRSHHTIRQSLQLFAALSIFIAAANSIPYQRRNGMYSDGARLLAFINSRVKTRRLLCILALNKQINSGVRLRHLKRTWIAHSCAIPDQSLDTLQGFWIAYLAENDRENAEQAAQNLERCLERFGSTSQEFQKLLLMEAAIFQAWFRDDEQKAKFWSQRSEDYPAAPLLKQLRLEICIHWAGRRYDELAAAWERGRIHIETVPASPAKSRLMEAWLAWRKEMDKKRVARETPLKP
jgi:hypothetical protein